MTECSYQVHMFIQTLESVQPTHAANDNQLASHSSQTLPMKVEENADFGDL